MKFDKEYTQYWTSAVKKSIDGTNIAGLNEVNYFLNQLDLNTNISILDLGCSYGRMFEVLSKYSNKIFGVDPDEYAVSIAKKHNYVDVKQGAAEKIPFNESLFDFVFCWAVMDVVNHSLAFKEINRALKSEGKFLITGKNINYLDDDNLAFKAEKNAYLKNFPGKYTNLDEVKKNIQKFGFEITNLFTFSRRGDMGNHDYSIYNLNKNSSINFYEYILIGKKIRSLDEFEILEDKLSSPVSNTAKVKANEAGFLNAHEYFASIGLD
jgi:SAM-dependent methyltransferase